MRVAAGPADESFTIDPVKVRVDASSVCQLRCPCCPRTTPALRETLGSGFLDPEQFERLLRENRRIRRVELSNYGEVFLNPRLIDIMRVAERRGVELRADNGANLNTVRPEVLEALVLHRFRSIACSIDGATEESYGRYRTGGSFAKVIENIRTLNRFKELYRSNWPSLGWQFIAFGHNEHEIPAARALAAELGMRFWVKLSWDDDFSPPRDPEILRREVGVASREEYRRVHGVDYRATLCRELWEDPQLNWDGTVLGCSRNFWGTFDANAFRDGFAAAVNSEPMRYARAMLAGAAPPRSDIPCTTCSIYLDRAREGSWYRPEHARPGRLRAWLARALTGLGRS